MCVRDASASIKPYITLGSSSPGTPSLRACRDDEREDHVQARYFPCADSMGEVCRPVPADALDLLLRVDLQAGTAVQLLPELDDLLLEICSLVNFHGAGIRPGSS